MMEMTSGQVELLLVVPAYSVETFIEDTGGALGEVVKPTILLFEIVVDEQCIILNSGWPVVSSN
jgi:hypothetical protein